MGIPVFTPTKLGDLIRDNRLDSIATMAIQTREYRDRHPGQKHGGIFAKKVVLEILGQNDCVALRYYFGIDTTAEPDDPTSLVRNPTLIICGINSNGDDILTGAASSAEKSWACPPDCSAITTLSGVQ